MLIPKDSDLTLSAPSVKEGVVLSRKRLPKSHRLLKPAQFQAVRLQGKRFVTPAFLIGYRQTAASHSKLGLTVSKKFGKAHERNQFKRLVREAFRHAKVPAGLELNISPNLQNAGTLPELTFTSALSQLQRFADYIFAKSSS